MAGQLTANLNDVNDTELRQLLRRKGIAVPALAGRGLLEDLANGKCVDLYPMTIIDWYRWAIMGWVNENWDTLFYQIECPLTDAGCVVCPDFQVVSCLVANRNVFDLTKEEVDMPGVNWPVLIMTMGTKREDAAKMLRAAAGMKLEDTKATRMALRRVTKAVFDLIDNGSIKATDYLGMDEKAIPQKVTDFATGSSVPEVLENLAGFLDGNMTGEGRSEPEEEPEERAEEKKDDLPKKDEEPEPAPKAAKTSGKAKPGYFPGVADKKPDSLPDDDSLERAGGDTESEPLPDRFDGPGADASTKQEPLPAGQPADLFVKGDKQGTPARNPDSKLAAMWTESEIRAIVRSEIGAAFLLLAEHCMSIPKNPLGRGTAKADETKPSTPPSEKAEAEDPKPKAASEPKPESKKGRKAGVTLPPAD